ncbi:MAG: 1-deoxy-D-xylulose-5-phosphate reductoisomerase [Candidatus Marinimicrobia bacterium]|nr:1-deoxy-D-xylulose-5-phosphate reductoisomerase [Candidatus Neomarinimicrobiota bacterium]|tara:strand:+ start:143 stop:1288 length:1146 start_codon:yes stop_codon:yes gene_type:complete
MRKRISILGSTGSIGVNALNVISHLKNSFSIEYLSANRNTELLLKQAKEHRPKAVAIADENSDLSIQKELRSLGVELLIGRDGLLELSAKEDVDIMLNGLVGFSGMEPTIKAIHAGVDVALSNKESLVMAGGIINAELKKAGTKLFPVDSEHSAIWQCLVGEELNDVNRLILTGSGGPFRERSLSSFNEITVEEALKHPNWEMGAKISIDSATMMNKGLEVIEAYWLFGFDVEKINIVIHPQSIIHSMIEMNDGSIKAQMGVPDMKVPIQYALTYPNHIKAPWERLDFFNCPDLTFHKPDKLRFPSIDLAYRALELSGTAGAALNLANDFSVARFLKGEIRFLDIPKINESILENHPWMEKPNLCDLQDLVSWVKNKVEVF